MRKDTLSRAERYAKQNRCRRIWHRIVGGLACLVVFVTTYMLILPAITMEKAPGCGAEEHTHTIECYEKVTRDSVVTLVCTPETLNVHTHAQSCYNGAGELTCGYADFVVHSHDSSCLDAEGNLICGLPEIVVHKHTDSCYSELEKHVHTDQCYTTQRGELICGLSEDEDHQHTDACYAQEQVLTCGLAESSGDPELLCGLSEIQLHTHTDECYDENGSLICGKPEVREHIHGPECFRESVPQEDALTCGLEENENHTHTELCYGQRELVCTLPEHIHGLACAADPTADVETAEVWEKSFADVPLTGDWSVDLQAIARTQLGYTESSSNYIVMSDGTTVKGYSRYGAWYGSPYGDWCAMFVSFCLNYAQVPEEAFPRDAACDDWIDALSAEPFGLYRSAHPAEGEEPFLPQPGDLIFFCWDGDDAADHVGIVTEWLPGSGEVPDRVTVLEGNSNDCVRYVTYDAEDSRILGYGALPEQTFYCRKEAHVHTAACLDDAGNRVCGLEEHIHTDICMEPPDSDALTELCYTGPDYSIRVVYGADAELPEGVTLEAKEIPTDSEEYRQYCAESLAAVQANTDAGEVIFARFFDIRFLYHGEKVEPAATVSVTITYAEAVETGDNVNCQAVHFAQDGAEVLDSAAQEQEDGSTSFTHIQDGFSVVGNVVTAPLGFNAADVGPDSLPVDYYVCIDGVWTCVGSTKTGWYHNWNGTEGWTNYNRDYITVEQAVSIFGPYGFTGDEENPSRVTAYQQKSSNTNIYSDTDTVTVPQYAANGTKILPLSRNGDHAGYNLYYLPNNSQAISNISSPDGLNKSANGFYTVKVYDAQGALITSEIVKTGSSFSYDTTDSGVTNWLVAYSSGSTGTISGSSIAIDNITSAVVISPQRQVTDNTVSHSVTFKVMIDGQWQTVGALPYYYSGTVNGQQRAYITSDMAAQFFGDFGYTATTAPGYQFGYSYNDIYTLFYANGSTRTNFCMDVAGGTLAEAQAVQLYTSNGSDAQIFRVWDAGNGYSFITPIGNSGFHVNVYGYSTEDPSSTQLKLSTATNANSQWKVDTGSDGRTTFWSALAPEDQVIDLKDANMANGGKLQVWHSTGGARYWYMVQQYRISNNTVSAQNANGTYNIGLTAESNGDIVCYYLPAETTSAYTNVSESAVRTANSFWSVSVRDDTNPVYSNGERSCMTQVVAPGGEATVTVRNADGVLWSCTGASNITATQSGGYTTFVIQNITGPVEVVATKANPSFTVQYYANIDRYVLGNDGNLEVIDTSGKKLPKNTGSQTLLKLTLEAIGSTTDQNHGNATSLNRVKSEKRLTKMYTDGTYNFEQHPGLEYFDKLWQQSNYKLDAVLVLKDGRSPDSTKDDDWWWYQINQSTWDNITFTNLASDEKAPRQEGVKQGRNGTYCILLQEGTVLRLRYETSSQTYTNQASFHDYDITSGQNPNGTWKSGVTGINKDSNYVASRNGQRKFEWTGVGSSTADVFAFGNQNCETGMGLAQWNGNNINAYNGTSPTMSDGSTPHLGNDVYKGCTFGLVTELDGNGNLIWDPLITAPHLFNDGTAEGKHSYNNGSLQFNQTGDTYTLTAANSTVGSRDKLEYFFNPSPSSNTTHTHIFTNNFWPMDSATNKTDPLMGAINDCTGKCDILVNGFWDAQNTVGAAHNNVAVPISDDGRAHNWFFGMNFSLSFILTEDYTGPLEYIFFGDDDMWVFLDNTLICDIGGVHSSVGEYVNLRDYLPQGSSGQHTLTFYYTERGASGSTCWMSFTLPSVTSASTGRDTGSLQIAKSVEDTNGADFSGEEYKFQVELLTAENGSALNQTFSYSRSDGTYGTIKSGGTIALRQNDTVTISGIPAGTFYRVTELSTQGYHTTVNGNEGYIISGKIETGAVKPASFVNTPYHELPQTGGAGTYPYTIGGIALMAGALMYYVRKRRREVA